MTWADEVRSHYDRQWRIASTLSEYAHGPIHQLPDDFRVAVYPPFGERMLWTYATTGMSQPSDPVRLEAFILSPQVTEAVAELLYAMAHFHRTGARLGIGHTVNFGRPWLPGSLCDHGLLSLPYLDGPKLENGTARGRTFTVAWLIPVTPAEVALKVRDGLDALESIFDQCEFDYANPARRSVVA